VKAKRRTRKDQFAGLEITQDRSWPLLMARKPLVSFRACVAIGCTRRANAVAHFKALLAGPS